jgi:hypothetical protein
MIYCRHFATLMLTFMLIFTLRHAMAPLFAAAAVSPLPPLLSFQFTLIFDS